MEEATHVIELATPFIRYVSPTILIISFVAIAEYFFYFPSKLIDSLRKRRFKL